MASAARVLLCCAMACASCADALALHDLSEADDAGTADEARSPRAEGGADADAAPSVPADGSRGAKTVAETGVAPPVEFSPVTVESDAASSAVDAGQDAAAPEPPRADDAAGPKPPRPDDATAPKPPQADAAGIGDAGARDTDGGASVCSACGSSGCTVHSNGVGQTFEDCQPASTYDQTQALEACAAFTGSSAACAVVACAESGGPGGGSGTRGSTRSDQAVCNTAAPCDCWTFSGTDVGLVQSTNPKKCDPCSKGGGGSAWN